MTSQITSEILNNLVSKGIIKIQQSKGGETFIFSEIINAFIKEHHLLAIKGN